MNSPGHNKAGNQLDSIRMKLRNQFPDAHWRISGLSYGRSGWKSGILQIDKLFPGESIPYGQLIEITGGMSSGKTSLLMRILAGEIQSGRIAYVDLSDMFYPDAALASGIDLQYLLVVKPGSLAEALRISEQLLTYRMVRTVVLDLVGQSGTIAVPIFHRLRMQTVRGGAVLFFLTEGNSLLIPPSMISLRLDVCRKSSDSINVTVSRSRISSEGMQAEVPLYVS